MRSQKTFEILLASFCCALLGLELIGFSSWYFLKTSQNPYQVFRQSLIITFPLAIFILVIALITARAVTKKRTDPGITISDSSSFIEYLKISRAWIIIVGVVIVMPIVLLLMVWEALNSPEGFARRNPCNMRVYPIGLGPILTLSGLGGMVFPSLKSQEH